MTTKRLTDTGIANLKSVSGKRLEIWDMVVPGLGLRVGGRRKTFIAMVRARGRLRRVTLGAHPGLRLAEARARARALIEAAQNGVDPVEARREAASQAELKRQNTVSAAVEDFVARYARPRQRSWLSTKRRLEMYLVEPFGQRALADLTRADVVRAIDNVLAAGYGIGANRTLANFKTFFRWCVERGMIERSPADLIRAPSLEISRDRVLTDSEIAAVWAASLRDPGSYGAIVRVLLLTAQRREEVAGMGWAELDEATGSWTLPARRTKGARLHVVPLGDLARAEIARLPRSGRLLFPSQADPEGERSFSGWTKAKRRLDELSGVTNWRLHDLRRTAATGMARAGISPVVIERLLNHAISSAGPLASVYQRYDYVKEKGEALAVWEAEVARLTVGVPAPRL